MTRKRIVLLYLGVGLALLIATFVVLQRAGVSRSFVENLLAKVIVRDRFQLGDATLSLGDGRLTLDEFAISTPDGAPERPLVAVDRVEVDVDTNPLGSVGRIRQVRLAGLHLDLDLSSGKAPDLSMILEAGDDSDRPADSPPAVFVDNARVTLRFAPDAEPIEFTAVELQLLPAEDAADSRMILSGSMVSPAGLATTVRGSADFETNQFRALLEIVDFPLDPSLATRFSPAVGDMLAAAELGGTAEKLTLFIEYKEDRADGDDLVAGVNVDLTDLRGVPPAIRYPLFGATARISASTRAGGSVHFALNDTAAHGDLSAKGELTNCFEQPIARVEVQATEILISPELGEALCSNPLLERIWQSFTPLSGRIDTHFLLVTTDDPANPRVDLDLTLDGVTVDWNGIPMRGSMRPVDFPEPLLEAHGKIHLRGGELRLDSLRFGACDTVAQIDGSIGIERDAPGTIELRTDEVAFGDRLRAALESIVPEAVTHYDEYSPRGSAGLHLAVHTKNDGDEPDVRLKISPLGASAEYAGFPCRLDGLRGSIEIEPRGVAFDLEGQRGAAPAKLHGRFFREATDDAVETPLSSEFWIEVDDFEVDGDLARAVASLGPELEETWKFLAPKGRASCEFTLWRGHDATDNSYDLRIDAGGAEVQLETLPIPIRKIHGPIFVHGKGSTSRIDVGVVHGEFGTQSEPAKITVQGEVHTADSGNRMDVVSVIRGLELTDELRDALDAGDAFDAEAWDVLAPTGFVDVIARQQLRLGDATISNDLDVTMLGVESRAAMLPAPATNLRGRVVLRDGIASFRDIRCSMAGSEVLCSRGLSSHDGTHSRIRATVSCDDFPIDDRLANLLSGPMQATFRDRGFDGRVHINELNLEFVFPDDNAEAFTLDLTGEFDVRNLAMTLGSRFEGILGTWRIRRGHVDTTGGSIQGTIEGAGFTVANHRVNGTQAEFFADANRLELRSVSGRLHNGLLHGNGGEAGPDLVYEFPGDGRLRASLAWRQVSLSSAIRAAGLAGSDFRGNLSGELQLQELVGSDIVNAVGHGEVHINDGKLGTVPMFTAIYSHLSPNRRPRFDSISVLFQLADRLITVSSIDIRSPLLSVHGNGSVTMGGYVDMVLDFADLFGSGADWLVLPRIARFLTSGVVQFQVHGYLRDPRATPQWLWESKPEELPIGPIPPRQR